MVRKTAVATALIWAASGLALLVAGCAAPGATRSATGARPTPAVRDSQPVPSTAPSAIVSISAPAAATSTPPTPRLTVLPTPTPTAVPVSDAQSPHFATPDDAMRYLVAAYNKDDVRAEMHVTTPDSRAALENERQWVKSFSFRHCTRNPGGGDYSCVFDMAELVNTPSRAASAPTYDGFGTAVGPMNEITVLVAPAQRPGWYMYFNEGCGDANPSSVPSSPATTTSRA